MHGFMENLHMANEPKEIGPGERLDHIQEEMQRLDMDMEKMQARRQELMYEAEEKYAELAAFFNPSTGSGPSL